MSAKAPQSGAFLAPYLVGRQDEVISPAAQRFMAKRANAHTIEINSSHASYISHPAKVTKLILRAARTVG